MDLTKHEDHREGRKRVRKRIRADHQHELKVKGRANLVPPDLKVEEKKRNVVPPLAPPLEWCKACKGLDLQAAFNGYLYLGTRILPLKGKQAECPLCKLFAAVGAKYPRRRLEDREMSTVFSIASIEYRRIMGVKEKVEMLCDESIYCLVVYPTRKGLLESIRREHLKCAILQTDEGVRILDSKATSFQGRVVKQDAIDYRLINDWLSWCWEFHPDDCFRTSPAAMRTLKEVGLRVIDVRRRVLRSYTVGMKYVSLSYVWGLSRPHPRWRPGVGRQLPARIPRTIEDAMRVCRCLGFEFLWVDQYCIDQLDDDDKSRQIRRMDHIYAQSALCIIAAAGKDADHGLPGVSTAIRKACPDPVRTRPGAMTLIPTLQRPAEVIAWSKWASRGWTYQEGVLANRRLIFTDEQVSFECRGMDCLESVRRPLPLVSTDTRRRLKHDVRPGFFRGKCNPRRKRLGISHTRTTIWQHAVAFNRRNLSYESDRLAAFGGILSAYGAYGSVSHVQGVPIDSLVWGRAAKWGESARASLMSEHHVSFVAALCWHTSRIRSQQTGVSAARRRPGLPSYTWLGTTGPIYFELIRNEFGKTQEEEKIYHALVRFRDFEPAAGEPWRRPAFNDLRAPHGLVVEAATMRIGLELDVTDLKTAWLSVWHATDSSLETMRFSISSFRLSGPSLARKYNRGNRRRSLDDPQLSVEVDCIRMMNYLRYGEVRKTYFMLIERHEGYIERIGLLELYNHTDLIREFDKWPAKNETLLWR